MYALHMLNQRVQILVTPEQRRLLDSEAKRRGVPVASLIRSAIDSMFGTVAVSERLRAVEAIRKGNGTFVSPEDLDRVVDEERANWR